MKIKYILFFKNILVYLLNIFLTLPVCAQYPDIACFKMNVPDQKNLSMENRAISKDTLIKLDITRPIYGLTVSGKAQLSNAEGFIRIVLRDNYNYDYLVYETNSLLADSNACNFNGIGEETVLLDKITPAALLIKAENATLTLKDIHYTYSPSRITSAQAFSTRMQQIASIVEKLNRNLEKKDMLWKAGETSFALKSYAEKKIIFGGEVPNLYGFEYYKDGIFSTPEYTSLKSDSISPYISYFDWRNRHGKNWMTSVKNQDLCGACWAFSTIGAIEANVNSYFNRLINVDLSEQELVACDKMNEGCNGGYCNTAIKYVRDKGIVDEKTFPYANMDTPCENKGNSPNELITIHEKNDFYAVNYDNPLDELKKRIIQSPMAGSLGK